MLIKDHTMRNGGEQKVYKYANGLGASVVRSEYTYGGDAGLFELAVVQFDGDEWSITYDTPITSDVIGHLDDEAVNDLLKRIESLEGSSDVQV